MMNASIRGDAMKSRRLSAASLVFALGAVVALAACSAPSPARAPLPKETKVLENASAEDTQVYRDLLAMQPKSWKVSTPKDIKDVQNAFPGVMIPRYTAGMKPVGIILSRVSPVKTPYEPEWTLTLCYEKGVWTSTEVYPVHGPMDEHRSGEQTAVGGLPAWVVARSAAEGTPTARVEWFRGRLWYTAGGIGLSPAEAVKIARSMAP